MNWLLIIVVGVPIAFVAGYAFGYVVASVVRIILERGG